MASSNTNENSMQCQTCQCGEGDKSTWNAKPSESFDKQPEKCPNCQILKSGPLFLSSKGIGWTQWKKRWFVLTHTSLVFYRSDPFQNALPQKGSEANPTLGSIDLVNSGSVVVKADKKLLTVFFPDGHDDRTFILKGETSEELQEWKTALEDALAQVPSAATSMGQSGSFRNEIADSVEASFEQWKDRKSAKSMVVGRPVILALEDVDGSPSFLEKALRFIEDYGIKVEGILRQSADVEEVERRLQEYEQGKDEFSSDEDAHVIGDCIKHVLRELPSSPVPASCCTALVEAYRADRGNRINAIRDAISETFPEPNLHLLQRILRMMKTVASHKSENRMSLSALAACMAPLLLRPLLAGDCEFEDNFNMGGDGSLQLLKAAAAANHAQAIVIIMLEEYDKIFDEELSQDGSSEIYTESEEDDIEDDESTDNDILEDDGYHDGHNSLDADTEDDLEHSSSGTLSGSGSYLGSDLSDNEEEDRSSDFSSPGDAEDFEAPETPSTLDATTLGQDIGQKPSSTDIPFTQETSTQKNGVLQNENSNSAVSPSNQAKYSIGDVHTSSPMQKSVNHTLPGSPAKFRNKSKEQTASMRRPTKWGRTSARKELSMESIDHSTDDESAIQRLETTKSELETKITKEVKGNEILQASLEKRKEALRERRLALEKDVEILREQLLKERDLRASLESGLMNMRPGHVSITSTMDSKTRADLEEINLAEADIINLKKKVTDLHGQLRHHQQPICAPLCASCNRKLDKTEKDLEKIVDTAFLHQNENSSTSDIVSSPADSVDTMTKSQTSLSSPKGQPRKHKLSTTNKDKMLPLESSSISSNELSAAISMNTASNKSTSRSENPVSGSDLENHKPQTKDSRPSTDRKLSRKVSLGDESMLESCDSSSKKSTSKGENPRFGADMDTEYEKSQNQNSPTLADAQPSQKLPRQTTSRSRTKSNDVSPTEEPITLTRNFASKRSSFRADSVKKEPGDSAPLPTRQISQRHQSSTTGDKDETAIIQRNVSSKKSFRSEDAASSSSSSSSSSSALTRLTNRLNFLKERRLQLANELQNLDENRTSDPQPPARTNSK